MQEPYQEEAAQPEEKPAAGAGEAEYWEIADQDEFTDNLSQDYEFSELVTLEKEPSKKSNKGVLVLIGLLFVGLAYGGMEFMDTGEVPGLSFITDSLGDSDEFAGDEAAKPETEVADEDYEAEEEPTDEIVTTEVVEGNPYWALPNEIVGYSPTVKRQWTAEEEENFRAGLNHRFTWQRHKTVLDVRNKLLRGSESILWDALGERKFWTRMHAAIGLADFNIPVTIAQVEEAIGDAQSQLVARFFKRFLKKSTAGARFMMRQAIRVLDESGRLSILRVLNRSDDELRDLYLVAATKDPSPRVQRWLGRALAMNPIEPETFNNLLKVVDGTAAADFGDVEVAEEVVSDEEDMSDEDGMEELAADDAGEVEFYEGDVEVDEGVDDVDYDEY